MWTSAYMNFLIDERSNSPDKVNAIDRCAYKERRRDYQAEPA